ncbi:MAG: SCP2 sterol-binding domain-containing protein [Proteobacteria bacterium]|nr:SCP2 sterol-binding domain-containing protein [Pseudomonadota bacterium]
MSDQMIQLSFSMKEIFELIPSLASTIIKSSPMAKEVSEIYKDSAFTFSIKMDDEYYHLIINNGTEFVTGLGDIENAMIKFSISMNDLQELIVVKNAYMFLGKPMELSASDKSRMAATSEKLSAINGTINIEVTNDNKSISKFSVGFNTSDMSSVTIKLEIEDFREIMAKKSNPINLFMAGRLKLEGDMGLALALQALLF